MRPLLVLGLTFGLLFAQDVLTNESVVKLVKSGMSEELILTVIRQQPGSYSLGADQLVELKTAGVSEKIIAAMLSKVSGKEPAAVAGTAPAAASPAGQAAAGPGLSPGSSKVPGDPGAYYQKGKDWLEFIPETVDWKTSGSMKNFVSAGIVKKDLKGSVTGPNSRNILAAGTEILLVPPQGVSVNEFVLVPMKVVKGRREFAVGPTNKKSGLAAGAIGFGLEKAGVNQYRVVLTSPLAPGEYGILLLSAVGSGTGMSNLFTFRLLP